MQKIFLFLLFIVILRLHTEKQTADFLKGLILGLSLQYNLMRRNCLLKDKRKEMRGVKKERKEGRQDKEEEVSS
jgi:hypothetical protein